MHYANDITSITAHGSSTQRVLLAHKYNEWINNVLITLFIIMFKNT